MTTPSDESRNLPPPPSVQPAVASGSLLPSEAVASLLHEGWLGLVTDCPALDDRERRHGIADFFEAVLVAIGDRSEAGVDDFRRALSHFGGLARGSLRMNQPHPSLGIELVRLLHVLASLAEDIDDAELWQRALEWQVCARTPGTSRAQAYAVLAEFLGERIGDPNAAGQTWILAAREAGSQAKDRRVTLGYWERAFAILSENRDVAKSLVVAYANVGEWDSAVGPFGSLLHRSDQPSEVAQCIELLLSLREPAIAQRASRQFAVLVDEVLWSVVANSADLGRILMLAKAQVFATDPDRVDAAVEAYFTLLDSQYSAEDFAELGAFIRQQADPLWRREQLRRVYEWQLARASEPAPILLDWARSEEQEFEDKLAAVNILERLNAQDPANHAALLEIRRLRESMGDWSAVDLALCRLADLATEPARSALDLDRAEMLSSKLGRHDTALDLIASALRRAADPIRASALLAEHLKHDDPELRLTAAEYLFAVSSQSPEERVTRLRAVLEATRDFANFDVSADSSRSKALRRACLEELVGTWSTVDDEGFALASEAVVEYPESDTLWAALAPWARDAARANDIVALYSRAIEHTNDRELVEQLGMKMSGFAESANVDASVVLDVLMNVVRSAPGARWALDLVKLHLGAQGRWADLLALYDGAMQDARLNGDRVSEMRLLAEASVTAKDLASDPERAIGYFERIFELDPKDGRTDAALERLYERAGYTERLVAHLCKRYHGLSLADARALDERIAYLWIEAHQPDRALEVIGSRLEKTPDWSAANRLLEQIFVMHEAQISTPDLGVSAAETAAQILASIHRKNGRIAELSRLLRDTLSIVTQPERRLRLLTELAETLESSMHDDSGALEVVGEALLIDPEEEWHRVWLGRLAGRLGVPDKRVRLLLQAASACSSSATKARLLAEAAQVARDLLNDPTQAIELYGQVVELGADYPELTLEALQALDPLLSASNHAEERCNVLECLAGMADDPSLRQYALRAAAQLAAEELKDVDRAATDWRALLDEVPSDLEALDGFIQALEGQGRWNDLAQTLSYRVNNIGRLPTETRHDRKRLAALYAGPLGEPNLALGEWERLLEEEPKDYESRDSMSELLAGLERWSELVRHLAAQIPHADNPVVLERRLALVHLEHTGDLRSAIRALIKAGDCLEAASLLVTGQAAALDDAMLRLEVAADLTAKGHGTQAVAVVAVQIGIYGERKPKERSAVHLELARAHAAIGDRSKALSELDAAVAIDPTNPAILAMHGQLALELSVLPAAEKSYRALLLTAMHASSSQAKIPALSVLYFRLAQIAERRGDRDRIEELTASALDAALTSEQQNQELEEALIEARADDLLLRALDNQLERADNPERAAEILIHCATRRLKQGDSSAILLGRLRDRSDQLSSTLSSMANPDMVLRAYRPLVALYQLLGDTECILALLMNWSSRFGATSAGIDLQIEAAKLMLGLPDRRSEGAEALLAVWNRDPARDDVAEVLEQALENEQRYDELLGLLRERINRAERSRGFDSANALRMRLGALHERIDQLEEAALVYESVVSATPRQRRLALEALVRVLELQEPASVRLGRALEGLLEMSTGRDAAEVAHRLATVFEHQHDQLGFERALGQGFAQDPTYEPLRNALVAMYKDQGQLAKARATLEYSAERAPGECATQIDLIEICEALGDIEGALNTLKRAMARFPDDAELNRRRWKLLILAGRHVEALEALEREYARGGVSPLELAHAIEGSGLAQNSRTYRLREVELLATAKADQEARTRLADWTRNHPDDAEAFRWQARLAVSAKEWGDAADALERLALLEPAEGSVAAALDLSIACDRLGDPARAIPALERANSLVPDQDELEQRLLSIYEQVGLHHRAAALCLERSGRPMVDGARVGMLETAAAHFAADDAHAEALAALEQAELLEPERLSIVISKVKALRQLKRRAQALEILDEQLASNRHARSRERYKLFEEQALIHLDQDELFEALDALAQATKIERAQPRLTLMMGLVAADLDDVATASGALRAALAAAKTSDTSEGLSCSERASAYAELCRMQLLRGSQSTARQLLEKAIEEDPNHHTIITLAQAMQRN